jgi:hypothetical protein
VASNHEATSSDQALMHRPPFVRLQIGKGLFGVTKLQWRTWPARNWLSWVMAGLFLAGAFVLIFVTTKNNVSEPQWHLTMRYGFTVALMVIVVTRLILEGTVSKPQPGQPPKWDKQLVDPWWTTIHTLTGIVLGLWLTPFVVTAGLTLSWELLEITVPGYGDEEINGNRLTDVAVAWVGWALAAGVSAWASGQPLPFV